MQKFLQIIGSIALIVIVACAVTFSLFGFALFFHYYPIGH